MAQDLAEEQLRALALRRLEEAVGRLVFDDLALAARDRPKDDAVSPTRRRAGRSRAVRQAAAGRTPLAARARRCCDCAAGAGPGDTSPRPARAEPTRPTLDTRPTDPSWRNPEFIP
jgi:hypothetical protein